MDVMATETKNLVSKLCEVSKAIGKIKKTGYNSYQDYNYLKEEDLTDVVREELANRNIFVTFSVLEVKKEGDIVLVKTEHEFHDGDSGQTLKVQGAGSGHDKLEKNLYKSLTGAQKYFLMKCFMVGTNDDPEQDNPAEKTNNKTSITVKTNNSFGLKKPESEQTEPVKKPTFGLKKPTTEKVEY